EDFSFADLVALRTLIRLRESRISPEKIRTVIAALRQRLRQVEDPLRELRATSDGKRIHAELAGQRLESVSGQLLLDFDSAELSRLKAFPAVAAGQRSNRDAAERWFHNGLENEQAGAVQDAIRAYEKAVAIDAGSAGAWLNLGTIFFN